MVLAEYNALRSEAITHQNGILAAMLGALVAAVGPKATTELLPHTHTILYLTFYAACARMSP